jgi:hypothetical protein
MGGRRLNWHSRSTGRLRSMPSRRGWGGLGGDEGARAICGVPPGLAVLCRSRDPTLKRGAPLHCAFGARLAVEATAPAARGLAGRPGGCACGAEAHSRNGRRGPGFWGGEDSRDPTSANFRQMWGTRGLAVEAGAPAARSPPATATGGAGIGRGEDSRDPHICQLQADVGHPGTGRRGDCAGGVGGAGAVWEGMRGLGRCERRVARGTQQLHDSIRYLMS